MMVTPFDDHVATRPHTPDDPAFPAHPDPYTVLRQVLQHLLTAAENAGRVLPGGAPEGLELHKAIQEARRLV